MDYETAKKEYERLNRGHLRLSNKIEKMKESIDKDPRMVKAEAKVKRTNKAHSKACDERYDLQRELSKELDKECEKIRKGKYNSTLVNEAQERYEKLRDQKRSEEIEGKGVFSVEDAYIFLKGQEKNALGWKTRINNLWSGAWEKDGKFYLKASLNNGVMIVHNKAHEHYSYSFRSTPWNTYFAFFNGKLIGQWRKERAMHRGDYVGESESYIRHKKFDGLTFFEWRDKLAGVTE